MKMEMPSSMSTRAMVAGRSLVSTAVVELAFTGATFWGPLRQIATVVFLGNSDQDSAFVKG